VLVQSSDANGPRGGAIFGHGAFLAVSWTWCIGMFLPVLLLRDFGAWAWAAFALPNFVGAAAMGAVLSASDARRVLQRHQAAIAAFSAATSAFQSFFLAWVLLTQGLSRDGLITIGVVVAMVFALGAARTPRQSRTLAVAILGASLALMAWWLAAHAGAWSLRDLPPPTRPRGELTPLAIVCAFGFLLCPYLDGTFLRTRAALEDDPTPRDSMTPVARFSVRSRGARTFAVGFLVLFPLMIAFTFLYAPGIVRDGGAAGGAVSPYYAAMPVIAHMAMQLMFTIRVHGDHVREGDAALAVTPRPLLAEAGLLIGLLVAVACVALPRGVASLTNQELAYRVFMSCYGLVFPAYALIMMTPRVLVRRGEAAGFTPARFGLLGVALVAGGAMFWLGFVEMRTWWGAAGVGVVALARIMSEFLPDGPGLPPRSGARAPGPQDPSRPALSASATP
jgi:hypothetical protein